MPYAGPLGIHYEEEGSGPAVVLMHGMGLGLGLWDGQLELAEEFRLIRYDARGMERSPGPAGQPGAGAADGPASAAVPSSAGAGSHELDPVGDLLGLLDHLGLEAAHLVAHSQAGAPALALALARPDRVASVVFVDSVLRGFPWSEEFLRTVRASAAAAHEHGVPAAIEDVWLQGPLFAWVRERRPEVFARVKELMRGWSGAEWLDDGGPERQEVADIERLSEVGVPAFVISGQEDAHDFVEIANMLTWWIPGAKQKSLLGVGHLPMLENAHEFNLYLRGFLRSLVR